MRLLVIEDDAVLGNAICDHYRKLGHGIDHVVRGDEANSILRHQNYDLIILDLNLPEMSGSRILQNLRIRKDNTPVLILTARAQIEDCINLLDLGADDYLTKPFDFGELDARCRALLRRYQGNAQTALMFGRLAIDFNACSVSLDGEEIQFKRREYRLLEIFSKHLGRVLSKEELINHLYGFDEFPSENAIETYVARVRKKIEGGSVEIKTIRGLGYLLEEREKVEDSKDDWSTL